MFLSALATLNFSLSLLVGLVAAPLTFVRPTATKPLAVLQLALLHLLSPMTVAMAASWALGADVAAVLAQAAFGWHVWGMWIQVVVWLVWWPAWFAGMVIVGCAAF
jgi:GPI-anchor transamidase subunit GAA1